MLPQTENIDNTDDLVLTIAEEQETNQTFGLNTTENTIGGKVDALKALQQSIYLRLSTEADQFIIYPYKYGIKTLDLIGKPSYYVIAVIPERIQEALAGDDRIIDISDFEFDVNGNKLHVKFIVHTIYGDVNEETVVIY